MRVATARRTGAFLVLSALIFLPRAAYWTATALSMPHGGPWKTGTAVAVDTSRRIRVRTNASGGGGWSEQKTQLEGSLGGGLGSARPAKTASQGALDVGESVAAAVRGGFRRMVVDIGLPSLDPDAAHDFNETQALDFARRVVDSVDAAVGARASSNTNKGGRPWRLIFESDTMASKARKMCVTGTWGRRRKTDQVAILGLGQGAAAGVVDPDAARLAVAKIRGGCSSLDAGYVVVCPRGVPCDLALENLGKVAGERPIVVLNPGLESESAVPVGYEVVFSLRPFRVTRARKTEEDEKAAEAPSGEFRPSVVIMKWAETPWELYIDGDNSGYAFVGGFEHQLQHQDVARITAEYLAMVQADSRARAQERLQELSQKPLPPRVEPGVASSMPAAAPLPAGEGERQNRDREVDLLNRIFYGGEGSTSDEEGSGNFTVTRGPSEEVGARRGLRRQEGGAERAPPSSSQPPLHGEAGTQSRHDAIAMLNRMFHNSRSNEYGDREAEDDRAKERGNGEEDDEESD